MVEHDKSFNIIGGYKGIGRYSDKIYKYDRGGGGQWVELPATLSEAKGYLTAIKVKASIFPTC